MAKSQKRFFENPGANNSINNSVVQGVRTADGTFYKAPSVVLTTGTFLNGRVHVGPEHYAAGRRDEQAVTGLSQFLKKIHFLSYSKVLIT